MKWVWIIIGTFLIIVLLFINFGVVRSMQVQSSGNQKIFSEGKVPQILPDGFYKGSVGDFATPWLGKKFDRAASTGINVFLENGKIKEAFPFKTYIGKGLQDKNLSVIKIDYSKSEPWWVRFVIDEIVEIKPNVFLGKVHIIFIPGLPFTIGYFRLEQNTPPSHSSKVTIKGNMVCLPHKNTSGPQTMECALGLQDTKGNYYALADSDPTYKNISSVSNNTQVIVEGVFTPKEDTKYQSIGTIAVTAIQPQTPKK